jgi:hypothetical protein
MKMNRDFVEMLFALSEAGAEFLVVGAYAVGYHHEPRATGDVDIWVRNTPENAEKVWQALVVFGAPLQGLTKADLASSDLIFQMGVVPCRIDLLTRIDGVSFDTAWPRRVYMDVQGRQIPLLGLEDLIANKRAAARPQDLADLAALEKRPR